jgi:3-carboxy-cis,cis-muconate cycloisomerase
VRRASEVFSEENTLELYLSIEAALAQAQADIGLIPRQAAERIRSQAHLQILDLTSLRQQTERTGYAVAPLVRQLTQACGDAGRYVHWGATTQDVVNTALALQINELTESMFRDLQRLSAALAGHVESHRDTVMAARTFGGHALPITFGFKSAVWLAAVLRHANRLKALQQTPMPGEFAGAAGTLASLGPDAILVRRKLMELLGLPEAAVTWASMRDEVFARVSAMAGLTNTLAKIAQDVAELSSTEIGELSEPNSGAKDTSSTLPYKSNPVLCAQIAAAASLVGQHAVTVLQAGRQHQERSAEGLLEIQVVGPAFRQAEKCILKSIQLIEGLQVFAQRMQLNLQATHGIILAERFMMALAPRLGRLQSHDLVHDACRLAVERNISLGSVLGQIPEVTDHLSAQALDALADPSGYLGIAAATCDRVLASVNEVFEGKQDHHELNS